MKTFRTKLKSSLILGLVLFSATISAKPVAQVIEVKGQAFKVSPEGKTSSLKINDHLDERTEVMVEEGGSVTLNDYYDATYHLIGGTHLKFFNQSVQLKRGKTWIKSQSHKHPLALTTANGHVSFWKSEFITTFDQTTSRSQVLVVNGDVELSNVLDRDMKYLVSAGSFSLIDPEVENGIPRAPTKVGLKSLNVALAEFKGLPAAIKETTGPARVIASIEEAPVKKGEIIFLQSNRLPASVAGEAHRYYKKRAAVTAPAKPKSELTTAPIRFYGISPEAPVPMVETPEVPRKPASLLPSKIQTMATQTAQDLKVDVEFAETLKMHHDNQPKHPKELERLIQDLKSY
jgi:hypothetical protein